MVDEELLGAIYVQLSRIYDVLIVALSDDNRNVDLVQQHTTGTVVGPAPMLLNNDESAT